ncbi:MAG: hypothetical protein QOF73_2188 [Thermomicrobiales bacterium]|nr:hypothetical protein [Thermomicrobiales bacterium]
MAMEGLSVGKKQSEFARLLRQIRTAKGLTQEGLAKKARLSGRAISDIERSIILTPHRSTRERLADALGLSGPERSSFIGAPPRRRGPSRRSVQLAPRPLPTPQTLLINRDQEVEAVGGLLRRTDVRLVTLLGPVGVGKTRLSLAVGADLQRFFSEGVRFVDLAAIDEPARLAGTIAGRLGVRLPSNQVPLEALAEQLRERRVLLILDNLEQLDAGRELVALLQMTTRLKILGTSRRSLHVRGEHEFAVQPLGTPDPTNLPAEDELGKIESVAMFIQCVQSDLPEFRLTSANARAVAEICARLDGLPLAIELAASRVKVMSPNAMVPRLQSRLDLLANGDLDLPERQQSLRAAIAWSCDLLPGDARVLFRRFAVFVGGATLQAVEAVCAGGESGDGKTESRRDGQNDGGLSVSDVWTAVGALIDASLIRREETEDGEVRFTVLQTIREWALEELAKSGEERAIRRRHAAWAVEMAEAAESHLFTVDEADWIRRLQREHDNLGAALEWSLAHDGDTALRLAGALADSWYLRGQVAEGADCLRRALDVAPAENPARVKGLVGASILTMARGDLATATNLGETALILARNLDDRIGMAKALAVLGNVVQHQRTYVKAFDLHGQALTVFTELGDEAWITNEICNLAWAAHGMGDDIVAASFAEQLENIAAATFDTYYASVALLIHGDLALAAGAPATAAKRYHEVIEASRRRDDRWLAADSLVGFAAVGAATDDPQRGARLLGAAEGVYRRLGVPFPPRDRPDYPDWLKSISEQLGEGEFTQAWSAGSALTLDEAAEDALAIASSLNG